MKISLSFGSSQGWQRVHTFWEKTTLILMHRLATCQDGVSSFHQALSSKDSGSRVLGRLQPRLCFNIFFFLLKLTAIYFFIFIYIYFLENFAFQFEISPNRARQSVSRCNNRSFKMSAPFRTRRRRISSCKWTNHWFPPRDLVSGRKCDKENWETPPPSSHYRALKRERLNMHHCHENNAPCVLFSFPASSIIFLCYH